jgi:hypothetical protein
MHNFLIKNKTKRILKKKGERKKCFLNLKRIHNILILLDTEDYKEVDVFIKNLKRMGKKVTSYAYKNKSDIYDYSKTSHIIIDHKEVIKLFDSKLNKIAEEIKTVHYDALFDLTMDRNPAFEFLAACADATFKVGYKKDELPLYDFTISALKENNDHGNIRTREFGRQILHYLSTIKAANNE